jgi:hypothetical protein
MASQELLILDYLRKYGSITPQDALNEFGCFRLGARICELRARGFGIDTTLETGVNKMGQPTRYARYTLRKGNS